jgi:hypothetical protein
MMPYHLPLKTRTTVGIQVVLSKACVEEVIFEEK